MVVSRFKIFSTCYSVFSYFNGLIKQEVLGRTNCLLSFDTTRTSQKTTRPKS
jgi:hypothetical protein